MKTIKNPEQRTLNFYRKKLEECPRLPRSMTRFADICNQTYNIIKLHLRLQGTSFTNIRNEERNRRIEALVMADCLTPQ